MESTEEFITHHLGIIFKMNIKDILAPYKFFELAGPSDNQGLLDFFKTMTMDTSAYSIRYDRGDDFFSFTNEQSKRSYVFIIRDEKGIIKGTAAIALIPHFLDGKKEICAYLGDLRISPSLNPKIRVLWKKCYSDIITNFVNLDEFKDIRYLYSAILDDNQNAMRSLLKNNDQIYYHELSHYETINIYSNHFFNRNRLKSKTFEITNGSPDEIHSFLGQDSSRSGMKQYISPSDNDKDELHQRFQRWENFSFDSFITVKNKTNNDIVFTCAPHMPRTKKLIAERMSLPHKLLGLLLPLLGIPALREKKEIKVLYLTHLVFSPTLSSIEKTEVLSLVLGTLLKNKHRNYHLISFFYFPQWNLPSLPFYNETTKAKLYQVMSKSQYESKEFLNLRNSPPAFEIGIA